MTKTEAAKDLHICISRAVADWARVNPKNIGDHSLLYLTASAVALELMLAAKASGVSIIKVLQAVKNTVTQPNAVAYIDRSYRQVMQEMESSK